MPAGQWSMVGLQIWWRSLLHASAAVCTPPMPSCITPPSFFECISLYECLVTLLLALIYDWLSLDLLLCEYEIHRLMSPLVSWLLLMPFKFPPAVQFHCIIWWHLKCTAFLNPPPNCSLSLCRREVSGLFSTRSTITGTFEFILSTQYLSNMLCFLWSFFLQLRIIFGHQNTLPVIDTKIENMQNVKSNLRVNFLQLQTARCLPGRGHRRR